MRVCVTATLLLTTSLGYADTQACIAQSERAQQARTDEHLRVARELFHACSAADCPESVRTDCLKSFDEIDRALPSIVVIARDHGRDVTNVMLVVDDETRANTLDGHALFVDPGTHRLRVETRYGDILVERDIVVHTGEKDRVIETTVTMPSAYVPAASTVDERRHTAGPWVVMGVGAVAAITGGVLIGLGQSSLSLSHDACSKNLDGSYNCTPALVTPDGQSRTSLSAQGNTFTNVGLITLGVGAAALIAGILWHFVEHPKSARAVTLSPFSFATTF